MHVSPAEAEHGTRKAAREFIAEMAGGLIAHASVLQIYAEWGNDAGLVFAGRCSAAYLRALIAGIEEMDRVRALEMYRRNASNIGPGEGSA